MSKQWLPDNFGYVEEVEGVKYNLLSCDVHVGIDYSESHRLDSIKKHMYPKVYRSLLVELGLIIPKDYSLQFGITPPWLYRMGYSHNNCGGFCVKAGLGQFKLLFETMPHRYTENENQEQEVLALGGLPFLKKTTKGVIRYLSMKEYREEFLELGLAEEDKWDIGGCACALPLGDDL